MFEVNFFEKKQKNFLPHLLSSVFLLLLVLLGVYFFSAQAYYQNAETRGRDWLQAEEEQLLISRQMQEYDQLTVQAAENKTAFEEKQYPMAYLSKMIIDKIPNGEQRINIFSKNETNQLTLVLEGLTVVEIAAAVEEIRTLAYVSDVQFINMQNQQGEAASTVELWVELDEAALKEEVQP